MHSPISDFFIRIKNAYQAGHESVFIPYSKFKHEIAKVLERSGFIGHPEKRGKHSRKSLELPLLYDKNGAPRLSGVQILSSPGRRLYASLEKFRRAKRGGAVLITTSRGVFTDKEARKEGVGGEVLAEIW